jgi:DNA-binding response OmpR family regulator
LTNRPRRVLIVEDDASIRDTLELALAVQGYQVATAANGRDGIALLRECRPDLIVLDLMMPVMDGWQFRVEQRLAGCDGVPVLVLTASRNAADSEDTLGAAERLQKPFDLRCLLDIVNRLALAEVQR